MTTELERKLRAAARAVQEANALLISAGAGMGVDSGLPDFRGTEGFWKAYPVAQKLGLSFPELANPASFENDAHLGWAFYGHRLNLYRRTTPHAGFHQLLSLAQKMPHGFFVFTSNVDGHFQAAGFPVDRVVECHGSIHHFQCTGPCSEEIWDARDENVQVDEVLFRAADPLPKCPRCGAVARPNIMMFDDFSWVGSRTRDQENWFKQWQKELQQKRAKLAIIECGAGTAIPTVRWTSQILAEQYGGTLIRINPREDSVPRGGIGLPLGAAEGIVGIMEMLPAGH